MDSLEIAAREAGLALRIRLALEGSGAYVITIHGEPMGRAGCPDFIVCWHGRFLGLEVKRAGNIPTRAQLRQMELIRKAGGITAVVHSVDEAIAALSRRRDE